MRHDLYKRIGSFVIKKADMDALPDWLQQLMARVIVLRADYSFTADGSEYIAMSPEFGKIGEGDIAPRYVPVVENGRFLRWGQW